MHGLVNRSIHCFVRDTYGTETWEQIATLAGSDAQGSDDQDFEAHKVYPRAMTVKIVDCAISELSKPKDAFLEDLGTYLASHPNMEHIRRLLRFGGETFVDFLYSLDDLPDRARLAVPDLVLPKLDIRTHSPGLLTLSCTGEFPGSGHVLVGILRAMVDDYGTLAMLDHLGRNGDEEMITIELLETLFTSGRAFELSARAG